VSENDEILIERAGQVASVTLNRPRALNALTQSMALDLLAGMRAWQDDRQVQAIVVRGARRENGSRPFCAGGDIRLIYGERNDPERRFAVEFYEQEYRLNQLIYRYAKPYIALIDGVVMGGGVGISIHGSHRVMSEHTLFAMPETGIGLFPDIGATYFLPRLPGKTGLYMGLTGARISAADAIHLGIGTHFVPSERMDALDEALCAGDFSGDAKAAASAIIDKFASDPGAAPLAEHRDAIDRCFAATSYEAIVEALEGEDTDWARETLATLATKSPTSLKITFRQLRDYNDLSFEEAMLIEYRMAIRCNFGHELFEGIRAVVVDKDRSPKWQPATIEAVSDADVDLYFEPPETGDMTFD